MREKMLQKDKKTDFIAWNNLENLVHNFESRKLPKDKWNHNAHLTIAIWYSFHYDFESALPLLRNNIIRYNESVGTLNTDTQGYHETLTRFWLRNAYMFIREYKSLTRACIDFINSPRGRKDYPLKYYSGDLLFSTKSRKEWVEPDLQHLSKLEE